MSAAPGEEPPLWRVGRGRLPGLTGSASADVAVVGLGGSGLAAVRRLVEAGRRVVAIDARGVAAGAGGRNGGFLLAGPAELHHHLRARLGGERARRFYELTVETRDRLFTEIPGADPRGSLRTPADEEELRDCRAQLEALAADGQAAESDPGGGVLVPGDGVFDPGLRARHAADAVADRARLFGGSPALEIEAERVVTPHGEIRAESVLVCVDGALERVLPSLAEKSAAHPGMRSLRLQMLATAPARDVHVPHAVYHRRGFDYWQQRPDGRIALGGGRDIGGEAEETQALGVTRAVQGHLERLLREEVGTQAEITHRWSGIVGYSNDELPIADEVADEVAPGVFAAGAYSGHGNVLGVMAAEAIADLALGRALPSLVRWLREVRGAVPKPQRL